MKKIIKIILSTAFFVNIFLLSSCQSKVKSTEVGVGTVEANIAQTMGTRLAVLEVAIIGKTSYLDKTSSENLWGARIYQVIQDDLSQYTLREMEARSFRSVLQKKIKNKINKMLVSKGVEDKDLIDEVLVKSLLIR